MIQRLRSIIALVTAALLLVVTLGRIEVDRTGRSGAVDASDASRPVATRQVDDRR